MVLKAVSFAQGFWRRGSNILFPLVIPNNGYLRRISAAKILDAFNDQEETALIQPGRQVWAVTGSSQGS